MRPFWRSVVTWVVLIWSPALAGIYYLCLRDEFPSGKLLLLLGVCWAGTVVMLLLVRAALGRWLARRAKWRGTTAGGGSVRRR